MQLSACQKSVFAPLSRFSKHGNCFENRMIERERHPSWVSFTLIPILAASRPAQIVMKVCWKVAAFLDKIDFEEEANYKAR